MVFADTGKVPGELAPITEENAGAQHLDNSAFESIVSFSVKNVAWVYEFMDISTQTFESIM